MSATVTAPDAPAQDTTRKRRGSPSKKKTRNAVPEDPTSAAVNLLSPWVLEENRVRTLRLRFFAAAVVLILLVGLAWTAIHLQIGVREGALRDQDLVTAQLQGQIADMAPVRSYDASLRLRQRTLAVSMVSEVAFSRALAELQDLLPAGTTIDTFVGTTEPDVDAVEAPSETAPCPGPDPFGATTTVGCVALSGLAPSREAVSQLVLALGQNKFFVEPFISTTTTDIEDEVTFAGSVGLDPLLLSGRFPLPEADETTEVTS